MKIFSVEKGTGVPVLFLHGFPFDHQLWDLLHMYLHENIRSITPDLRGFGKSKVRKTEFTMQEMAKDVVDLIDEKQIGDAIVIGHSMGGYLGLEMIRQNPDRVRAIVLVASHVFGDTEKKKESRLKTKKQLNKLLPSTVFKDMPKKLSSNPEVQKYCMRAIGKAESEGLQGALYAMANRKSSEDLWASVDIPKLLIAGKEDQFISRDMSDEMAEIGREVNYVLVDGAGHMLMCEKPTVTARIINAFTVKVTRN